MIKNRPINIGNLKSSMLIRISQADTFVQEIPTVPRNDRWDRLLEKLESIEEVVYDKTEFDNRTEAIRHGYLD